MNLRTLLAKRRDEAALKVLHAVARTNKPCNITMETFEVFSEDNASPIASDNSEAAMLQLPGDAQATSKTLPDKINSEFKKNHHPLLHIHLNPSDNPRRTIYAFDYLGFSIAGSFLPTILGHKNSSIDVAISETYRDYNIIYCPGTIGVARGSFTEIFPSIGRKQAMVLSSALMGTSLFLFTAVNTLISNIGSMLSCMVEFLSLSRHK